VFAASCLSMSAAMSSLILSSLFVSRTCFSTSRIVSSECPSFAFLACVTALERTFLSESLALLLNCLASLTRFSLCSRVTLVKTHLGTGTLMMVPSTSGFRFMLVSLRARVAAAVLLIWLRGNFPESKKERKISRLPGEVRMLRLRVKSSLSALRTAVMSSFTSSRLMMSSTRAELIFTFADWPFALAWKEGKALRLISKTNNI
uniref:Secreted protein n=1 Tax=Acanthochromis polyacanthus TaxID=80966 RepID=A0A3Q1EA04_9TELE